MAAIVLDVFASGVFEDAVWTGVYTDVVERFDLVDKHVHIRSGISQYHPVDDIYRELRFHRANDETLRVIDMPIEALGNIFKGAGKYTARLAIFKNGWKIVPANESHTLKVLGEQISDIGESGVQLMDLVALDPGVNVSIEYAPPDTEIVQVSVPSVGLTTVQEAKLDAITSTVEFIKQMESGKWEIAGSEMIFYEDDNTTEIARFAIDDVNAPKVRTRI